jgi:hypothetical protein
MKKKSEFCTYDSSMIRTSRYNFDSKELDVEFNGGTTYRFNNVDTIDYLAFANTEESVGKSFNQHIRKYEGKKTSMENHSSTHE